MTSFQVDSDAVISATGAVRSSIGRLQAEVNGLLGQLVNLQNSWTGPAAVAFQGIVNEWRGTQSRVEESLNSINEALSVAGQQYAEIEESNARMFTAR
jgi:WXG100 family type VII secretion target